MGGNVYGPNIQIGSAGVIYIALNDETQSGKKNRRWTPYASTLLPGDDVDHPILLTAQEAKNGTRCSVPLYNDGNIDGSIWVNIPPGVSDKTRLRIRGKGVPGKDGSPAGDLYIKVFVKPTTRPSAWEVQVAERAEAAYLGTLLRTTDEWHHFSIAFKWVVWLAETQNMRDSRPVLRHLRMVQRPLPSDLGARLDKFIKEASVDSLKII
ncbi:DnaJ C-terminal domain-containing protein [Spirillospora sp. CA-255316]